MFYSTWACLLFAAAERHLSPTIALLIPFLTTPLGFEPLHNLKNHG